MLSSVVLGLGILWVRPEVELVCGIRVEPGEGLESEAWPGAVSESELYSGTGSLPARHEEGAPVRALRGLRGPRVERSRDGGPHAMAEQPARMR
jgi:hypothetical protein